MRAFAWTTYHHPQMYVPRYARVDDREEIVRFMRENGFATLVSVVDGAPFATHVPLVVDVRGDAVVLSGHLARANPQARSLGEPGEVLAIFQGPHAYVSPSLYESVQNVPTWNYTAVHAYGTPRPVRDAGGAAASLEALVREHEAAYLEQWSALPEKYRAGMMSGIAPFEIEVARLEAKYKLSQNRTPGEQARVARELEASPDPVVAGTGRMMRRNLDGGAAGDG